MKYAILVMIFALVVGTIVISSRMEATPDVELIYVAAPGAKVVPPLARGAVVLGQPALSPEFDQILQSLPRVKDAHRNRVLMEASVGLGRVTEVLRRDPALVAQGTLFFHDCAAESDLMTAVRAVCLRDLRYWSRRAGLVTSEAEYSTQLRKLADVLPAN